MVFKIPQNVRNIDLKVERWKLYAQSTLAPHNPNCD